MNTPSVTIQGNTTAVRYPNYPNYVILSVLLHDRVNFGMMLARDYTSCYTARSTPVMIVSNNVQTLRWPAKSLDLNPLIGPIETQGSCTVAATKSQGASPCYSSYVCGHSTTVYP